MNNKEMFMSLVLVAFNVKLAKCAICLNFTKKKKAANGALKDV